MRRYLPSAAVVMSTMALLLSVLLYVDVFSRAEQNTKIASEACIQDNQLRREVNEQAKAFVHHNDSTLAWAIAVRPIFDRTTVAGERYWRATGKLIRAYRGVRRLYYTLPIVDCSDPELRFERPSRPVAP